MVPMAASVDGGSNFMGQPGVTCVVAFNKA